MMSKEKYRLHPISAILLFLKSLKDLLLPMIIVFVGNGLDFSISLDPREKLFWDNLSTLILIAALIFILIGGIIKWWKFVYWFEDNELRVEYGLFVKKKRYIPFDRIQSLNYKEGIFHRVLGLVQVRVETAGGASRRAEAELTAVTKQAAEQIEAEMKRAKKMMDNFGEYSSFVKDSSIETHVEIIHKMSTKHILLHATTSGAVGVVLSGMAAVLSQFSEVIPYDKVFNELTAFVKVGVLLVGMTVILVLCLVWIISVFITSLNYYDFTVTKENEKLIITRGLLEKKRMTIPLNRVQAIRIVENPIRQIFGYATVVLESAGGNSGEKDRKVTLFPLIKKGEELVPLKMLFPDYEFISAFTSPPRRALPFFYRLNVVWALPIITAVSYYFYPYGLFAFSIIPLVAMLGYWRYCTNGFFIKDKQLTMRFRKISRITMYMKKHRIQAVSSQQSYFQKRKQLASVQATVMSGTFGATAQIFHIEEHQATSILKWYEYEKELP